MAAAPGTAALCRAMPVPRSTSVMAVVATVDSELPPDHMGESGEAESFAPTVVLRCRAPLAIAELRVALCGASPSWPSLSVRHPAVPRHKRPRTCLVRLYPYGVEGAARRI